MTTKAPVRELLSFDAGGKDFCVDVLSVREIKGWRRTKPLPHTPNYILGVIDLRGALLTVIDLAARFGFTPIEPSPRHVVIIAEVKGRPIGLLVNFVSDILTIPPSAIQDAPDFSNEDAHKFVTGLLPIQGRMISVLSLERLVDELELAAA